MTNPAQMTATEIKNEMEGLRYKMETSILRRHEVPELYKAQEARYFALDDERVGR